MYTILLFAAVTLAWDPMAVSPPNVRIYERTGQAYSLVAEVAGTVTTATVPNVAPGVHYYIARSADGSRESADSNMVMATVAGETPPGGGNPPVIITPIPTTPTTPPTAASRQTGVLTPVPRPPGQVTTTSRNPGVLTRIGRGIASVLRKL